MRRIALVSLCLMLAGTVFAGGIVTNGNQSAEYVRTLNRNASVDADAAYYNPAGTAMLGEGFTVSISNQSILQTKEVTSADFPNLHEETFTGDVKAYLFPDLHLVYKTGNLALSACVMPIGGGGTAEYASGLPMFEYGLAGHVDGVNVTGYSLDANFSGSSVYIGGQIGVSYAINDMFSVALGGRYVSAKNTYEGTVEEMTLETPLGDITKDTPGYETILADLAVDAEATGSGYTGIVGVNIAPMDGMNIGLRYEHITQLELETNTTEDNTGMFPDGDKADADMPGMFGAGVSYFVTPEMKLEASFNYYMNTGVGWDPDTDEEEEMPDDFLEDGYEGGLAVEYAINEALKASVGFLHTKNGRLDNFQSEMDFGMDSNSVGLGVAYSVIPGLDLNLGFVNIFYSDAQNVPVMPGEIDAQTYSKTTYGFVIGCQYTPQS